ncbi:N-acetylmuramoyl-L-alanine amidase [Pelosinus sp. sgz500959]|uniref:N-acetylmuramoyl-L-alanine amidase family protein n=1 Tax=Pelosinus sp. sgz500959 TaxID=3242472 RepID=UPI0036701086
MKKQFSLTFITLLLLLMSPISATVNAASYAIPTQNQDSSKLLGSQKSSLKGKVIVIDPGHGGSDTGAIGPSHIAEKNVTLTIARDLRNLLSDGGAKVILTRTSDQDVAYDGATDIDELQARVDIANQANADLFISIHADAFANDVNGTATYFYPGSSDSLARFVQGSMIGQMKLYDRGVLPNDYYVLKYTNMPSILTEVAFISNPKEEKLLASSSFDRKVALGIFNGIKKYFLAQ